MSLCFAGRSVNRVRSRGVSIVMIYYGILEILAGKRATADDSDFPLRYGINRGCWLYFDTIKNAFLKNASSLPKFSRGREAVI
jgi:hypothetical protein